MKISTPILFLSISFSGLFLSQTYAGNFSSSAKGGSVAQFLKIGVDARAVSMGEAASAVVDDATALYWNPAALRRVEKNSFGFMHASYLDSSRYEYASFAHTKGKNTFALSYQGFSYGDLAGRDDTGADTGSFQPNDSAFSAGWAHSLGEGSLGVSAKYIRSKIVDTAATAAVDVGYLSRPFSQDKFNFAATLSNVGGTMKFDNKSEKLPLMVKIGSSFKATKNWVSGLDVAFPKDNSPYAALGSEYRLSLGRAMMLAGRAGYNSRTTSDVSGFSGFSFGAGFGLNSLKLDYAVVPFGDLGLTHRFSLGYSF